MCSTLCSLARCSHCEPVYARHSEHVARLHNTIYLKCIALNFTAGPLLTQATSVLLHCDPGSIAGSNFWVKKPNAVHADRCPVPRNWGGTPRDRCSGYALLCHLLMDPPPPPCDIEIQCQMHQTDALPRRRTCRESVCFGAHGLPLEQFEKMAGLGSFLSFFLLWI